MLNIQGRNSEERTRIILATLAVTGLILAAGGCWAYKTLSQETPIDKDATVKGTNCYSGHQ